MKSPSGTDLRSYFRTLARLLVAAHRVWYSRFAKGRSTVADLAEARRGQITAAITAMGYACPEIDLVWMLQAESRVDS